MKSLLGFQREIYHDHLRKFVDQQIESYEARGYFQVAVNPIKNMHNSEKIILKVF